MSVSSFRTMSVRCEGCIFYELSNAWQVDDTRYSDILASR